jgi:hypothetical protein
MVTSLTNLALLMQFAGLSGTNAVGVDEGVLVPTATSVAVATTSVGATVADGAVVAGTAVGVSVTCAACPPQADKTIPASKIIESALFDMLPPLYRLINLATEKQIIQELPRCLLRATSKLSTIDIKKM